MDIKTFVEKLDARGLDVKKLVRVENLAGDNQQDYSPSADIVNLWPVVLAAASGDLLDTQPDETVEKLQHYLLDAVLPKIYDHYPENHDYGPIGAEIGNHLNAVRENLGQELYGQLTHNVMIFMYVMYAISCKQGLRGIPCKERTAGVYPYCAAMALFNKLSPETQKAMMQELSDKQLWGVE